MKIFSRQETVVVLIILFCLGFISFFNFQDALKRGRDNERKNDLSDLKKALEDYHSKYNMYPSSLDALSVVMKNVPKDPSTPSGRSYLYLTDGKYFQIYAGLEANGDSEYNSKIVVRNLKCGNFVCSFGRASGETPLDKSLQEYENELDAKKRLYTH